MRCTNARMPRNARMTVPPAENPALLQAFSARIASDVGLSYPVERWPELTAACDALARDNGLAGAAACMQHWLARPPQRPLIDGLMARLAVGETYFFREPASFEALEQQILPLLIAQRRTGRRLRLWSAGCATGEEAFTLAIVLQRLLPDLAGWDIGILGTDIHPGFLASATQGIYRDWSFRGVPAAVRRRHFDALGQGRYRIGAELRRLVRFTHLNLADDAGFALLPPMDLVLCRHVLMYFDAAQARLAVERLHRTLVDGGWLLVSSAEVGSRPYEGFDAVPFEGMVAYRKAAARPLAGAPPPSAAHTPASALPRAPQGRTDPALAANGTSTEAQAPALAAQARAHADRGDLPEALRCCEAALALDPCHAGLHYLQALIHEEHGQPDAAMSALRRVIYLDPGFVLARVALGRLCDRQGRAERAERHFSQALRLLERQPAAAPLPGTDDVSAGHLSETLAARLARR